MTIYEYFEKSEYDKAFLCESNNSTYTLIKENGKVGLNITIIPNDRRVIFDKETIHEQIDKLLSEKNPDTISFMRNVKINQIINPKF